MGLGFVLAFYLVFLTAITFPFAVYASRQRKFRNDLSSFNKFIRTYFASYCWMIMTLFVTAVMASFQGRDIGIGDFWERKISSELSVCAIDIPSAMQVCRDGEVIESQQIAVLNSDLVVVNHSDTVCYDLSSGKNIACEYQGQSLRFQTPVEYYEENQILVLLANAVAAISCLMVCVFAVFKRNRFALVGKKIKAIIFKANTKPK